MTGKDFRTPLGRVRTDRAFIRELEQALGSSLRGQECDHRAEHSVELQVQMLQVCFPEADFVIVPVLCPNVCGETGLRPADGNGPDLGTFADELAAVVAADAQRTVLIAGADFSHVGQTFGDARPADAAFLAEVERVDRGLLDLLARDEPDGFLAALLTTSNRTRACSSGCLYALRRALRGRPLRVLAYHQATDPESDTNVTCAAAVIE
jgi:AmmeMemoRadiSam system protein B